MQIIVISHELWMIVDHLIELSLRNFFLNVTADWCTNIHITRIKSYLTIFILQKWLTLHKKTKQEISLKLYTIRFKNFTRSLHLLNFYQSDTRWKVSVKYRRFCFYFTTLIRESKWGKWGPKTFLKNASNTGRVLSYPPSDYK